MYINQNLFKFVLINNNITKKKKHQWDQWRDILANHFSVTGDKYFVETT